MKKVLLFALFAILSTTFLMSQEADKKQNVYCEMIGSGNFSGNKIKISFDFGNQGFSHRADSDNQIVDEKGNPIKFTSMIDALNYMASRGWKLCTAFPAIIKSMGAQETYRYILVKEVNNVESMMEGINLPKNSKK